MGEILLGTSGWSYKEWVGPFYKLAGEKKLTTYASVFNTAEVNSTFYAYPSKGTVIGWNRYTGKDFVFTAKIPRLITHKKKLDLEQGVEDDLTRFCDLMQPLQSSRKLGCLLIQFPPSLRFDSDLLESFFSALPKGFRFAVEFRHPSLMVQEAWKLLEDYGVAYTVVDEPLLPPELKVTADIAYFRWHGKGERPWYNYRYSMEELKPWVPKLKETADQVDRIYGYFNNHFHGYAVENCIQVLEMLGILTPEQMEAKETVQSHLEGRPTVDEGTMELTQFLKEERGSKDVQQLLTYFMDTPRITRAKKIKDKELKITEARKGFIEALIRRYRVIIDTEKRLIVHDCADWSRTAPSKRFCKHLGKIMMHLDEDEATEIMEKILKEKERWEFRPEST